MEATFKRVTVHLNKHELEILGELMLSMGESQSHIMRAALLKYNDFITMKEIINERR